MVGPVWCGPGMGVWECGLHLVESRWDGTCTHGGMFGGDISKEDASAGWGLPSYKLTVSHSHAKLVKLCGSVKGFGPGLRLGLRLKG